MADTERTLKVIIDAEDQASGKIQNIGKELQQVGKYATIAGVAIVGELGLAVKAAAESETATKQLNFALDNTAKISPTVAKNLDGIRVVFDKHAEAAKKLGFSDEQVQKGLGLLITSTQDAEVALEGSKLAMDLARAKGIELETAQMAINMALQGSPKLLKQYGIALEDGAGKVEVLDALSSRFGGTAQSMAGTLEVQTKVLAEAFDSLQEAIGTTLLPILSQFLTGTIIPLIDKIKEWAEAHPTLFKNIILVVGAIGLLLAILGPILMILPGLMTAFTLLSGPIGLIALAIMGLIAVGILLYANWSQISAWAIGIWGQIVNYFKGVIDTIVGFFNNLADNVYSIFTSVSAFFTNIWNAILNFATNIIRFILGVIILALDYFFPTWQAKLMAIAQFFYGIWEAIKLFFTTLWENIKLIVTKALTEILNFIVPILAQIKKAWDTVWQGISDFFSGIWNGIKSTIKSGVDYVTGVLNDVINLYNKVKDAVSKPIQVVTSTVGGFINKAVAAGAKMFATGGVVTRPTLGIVGEAGPEAVVPLNKMSGLAGVNITITGNTFMGDEQGAIAIGDMIVNRLKMNLRLIS